MRFRNLALVGLMAFSASLVQAGSLTTTASPCLDNNIVGEQLKDQFDQYKEARDKVVEFQQGNEELNADQVINLVTEEVQTAVKSWVRAACALYLGDLKKQAGDIEGAKEAYDASVYYAKAALKFQNGEDDKVTESQDQGAKYLELAKRARKRLK